MFNNKLKKEALRIHEESIKRYNASYEEMKNVCEKLYLSRVRAVELIQYIQKVINSIANTPKEFDTEFGKISKEIDKFHNTEEYARKAYAESVKSGINLAGGVALGAGIASMAPTLMMSIATTFGTASTGTAISALSGAAAQKAAVAWIGRTFAGLAVKQGAGMAAGQAFLSLAGPIGWTITAVSTGVALHRLNSQNREVADNAIEEAKSISKAREALDEMVQKINHLDLKTKYIFKDLEKQKDNMAEYMNADYVALSNSDKYFLGSIVNNTLSLATLINKTIG